MLEISKFQSRFEFISAVLLFYVLNTYAYVSFLGLARKWPKLMQTWELTESVLPHFRYQRQQAHFMWKIRFISITILFFAFGMREPNFTNIQAPIVIKSLFLILVEHLFYVGSMFHFITTAHSEQDPLPFIVENCVPYTFNSTRCIPTWATIPINFISITASFVWNFLDAFILVISIGLSTLFQLFNDELMDTHGEVYVLSF